MKQYRQLAAIMFTDIVGYTALMGDDEQDAFDLLKKNRGLQKPLIEQYGGKWIKELGDGVMATFSTVTDAVSCACSIINGCQNIEGLKLRIGIHQAEVVFENNDVFGDGVNIASRLQALAPVGGICISETVHNNIANRKEIKTNFLRQEALKHVKEPVRIYEVVIDIPDVLQLPHKLLNKQPDSIQEKSIAVLPFVDMSAGRDQEYLGDGLAEELINVLSQIRELKVIGRTSSFSFKKKEVDLKTIGDTLNANTILEGSVQKAGNRIRITAQLINVSDSYHIWSQRYDREMNDIFALQDDICSMIAEHLKVTLLGEAEKKEDNKPTMNLEAYEMYLKGRFYLEQSVAGFERALEYFHKTVELDPTFADAQFFLGVTYFNCSIYLFLPFKEGFEKAKFYSKKTLALDHNHVDARSLLAMMHYFYDWDWQKAALEFDTAKKISGGEHISRQPYYEPWYRCMLLGDCDTAIDELQRYVDLDPLSALYTLHVGYLNLFGRRSWQKARAAFNRVLEIDPAHSEALRLIAHSYRHEGRLDLFEEYSRKSVEVGKGQGYAPISLAIAMVNNGKIKEAEELYESIKHAKIPATSRALIMGHFQKFDEAFEWLDKAFEEKDFWLVSTKYSADWDIFRSDPRFDEVMKRMNFPQ